MDYYVRREAEKIECSIKSQIPCNIARQRFETFAMFDRSSGVSDELFEGKEVIVSLTTYGKRINNVFRTIESVFQQTRKANRVILWLADDEYSEAEIPLYLLRQKERGLEIKYTKDIKSYKKLIPTLQIYPDAFIITIDDDYMYPLTLIEHLLRAHKQFPNAVCSMCARTLRKNNNGTFDTYESFKFEKNEKYVCSMNHVAEGFGGILYPPHCFHHDIFNEKLFISLTPHTDDLWFKAMEMLNGTPVVSLNRELDADMYIEDECQETSLSRQNLFCEHRNDKELKAVFEYYNLYDKIN